MNTLKRTDNWWQYMLMLKVLVNRKIWLEKINCSNILTLYAIMAFLYFYFFFSYSVSLPFYASINLPSSQSVRMFYLPTICAFLCLSSPNTSFLSLNSSFTFSRMVVSRWSLVSTLDLCWFPLEDSPLWWQALCTGAKPGAWPMPPCGSAPGALRLGFTALPCSLVSDNSAPQGHCFSSFYTLSLRPVLPCFICLTLKVWRNRERMGRAGLTGPADSSPGPSALRGWDRSQGSGMGRAGMALLSHVLRRRRRRRRWSRLDAQADGGEP